MALYNSDIVKIEEIVGKENVTTDELDLLCYSRDLASSIPDELLKGYGMLGPEVVVKPQSIEHVAEIMKYAYEKKIPITPRGAGTWALGGVLPMDGGIVLDLCALDRITELDAEDEYVRVETGIEWKRLIDYLETRGFQAGANPSSGVSATVGGYIATGGSAGIGVTKYGTIGEQILSLKVVLADGTVVETNPWDSWMFIGSEGSLGVICEATLKVFKREARRYLMFAFDSVDGGTKALAKLYKLKPYYLTFLNRGMVGLLNEATDSNLYERAMTISIVIDGTEQELEALEKQIDRICTGALKYPEEEAEEEWNNRYKVGLSFKSLGPSMFAQEMRLPVRFLSEALDELEELLKNYRWGIESLASDNNTVVLSVLILADERNKLAYLKQFSLALFLFNIAVRNHGCMFGSGLHNAAHMPKIHGEAFSLLQRIKDNLDPSGILNQSKTTQMRLPRLMLMTSMVMMRYTPWLVLFGLETIDYLPLPLIRFGLGILKLRIVRWGLDVIERVGESIYSNILRPIRLRWRERLKRKREQGFAEKMTEDMLVEEN